MSSSISPLWCCYKSHISKDDSSKFCHTVFWTVEMLWYYFAQQFHDLSNVEFRGTWLAYDGIYRRKSMQRHLSVYLLGPVGAKHLGLLQDLVSTLAPLSWYFFWLLVSWVELSVFSMGLPPSATQESAMPFVHCGV